jgi:hypothetical protein
MDKENNELQAYKQQQVAPAKRIDSNIDLSLFGSSFKETRASISEIFNYVQKSLALTL